MRRGARQERRAGRRENRTPARAAALGAVVGAGVAAKTHEKRYRCGGDSDGSSDDDGGQQTFAMREKLLAFGDDFTINKMSRRRGKGRPAYYANNKILRLRETFNLQACHGGKTLYQIQERKLRIRDSMAIEDAYGHKIAEIKKRAVGVVRDNFVVKVKGDNNWQVHGSILEHNFTIKEHGREIVKVHKKWVAPIRDCYFIDVHGTDDVALALMVVIGLEAMTD
mmetsp:Transcript_18178/g.39629  ORF Transcript_18178/g.39629 Transcript_18178/m.39629 type:complete len:224 (-) Transcript_18178:54-725(-)